MARAYRELIDKEAERAEADLTAFRSRALSVITTSSGLVTLLTGLITFAASKAEDDKGVADGVIALLALSFAGFFVAALLGLWTNMSKDVDRPAGTELDALVDEERWERYAGLSSSEERQVAKVTATYVKSVRSIADTAGCRLNLAIGFQVGGLLFAAIAGVVAAATIN